MNTPLVSFQAGSPIMIAGPTGSGKTFWTNKLLKKSNVYRTCKFSFILLFDIDLASLIYYADENDGYKYLLVVIDIFSRYGWVEPLKDKTANEIVKAFDKVLQEGRIPKRLRSDSAKDFTSEKFQKYVKS